MKIIKIFLLLSLTLWSQTLPKTPKCIEYKTIKNVLSKGWEYSDQNLTKWVEKDGETFLEEFKKMITTPLRQLTDKEYLEKEMESYEYIKKTSQELNYDIRNKSDYIKRQKQLMKHGIYYGNYTNRVYLGIYRYALILIKHFENQQKYSESFKLYMLLLERLISDIEIHGKTFFEITMWRFKEEELFLSLNNSLQNNKYTQEQREMFSQYLFKLLAINKSIFIEIIQYERKLNLAYLQIELIENKSFNDHIKHDTKFYKNAIKSLDRKTLKSYFEDKKLMQKLIDTYMQKLDEIFSKLVDMDDKVSLNNYTEKLPEYYDKLSYLDRARLFLLYGLDKVGLPSLSKTLQYKFNEDEFVEVVSDFMILSGKPWVFGKYKFEWEEIVRQNEKLLDLSRHGQK